MNSLRYFRLYTQCVKFSFMKAMQFRFDFWFRVGMDLVYYIVNLFFFKVIYLHTSLIGDWTEPQMMVFVSAYLVVDALNMTLFSNNLWWLSETINRGDLDYVLTRPVSSLFLVSLRDFAANSFVNLIMAASIMAWAISSLPGPIDIGSTLFFILLICNGTFIYYLIEMLFIVPVFWTHSGAGFKEVFWTVSRYMERPDAVFHGWARVILVTILPFLVVTSFPARLFLNGFNWAILAHIMTVTAGLFLFILWLWNRGLRAYSSASS